MFALHLLSYLAGATAALFLVLSMASGLLYVAEIVEEHSKLAKIVGQRIIYSIIVLYCLLYAVDGLPFYITILGIISQLVYLQNFSKTWPTISLWSLTFIASCVLVIVSHFVSFQYWTERAAAPRHFAYYNSNSRYKNTGWFSIPNSTPADDTFLDIATYFALCIWLVPFYLFLSLSANDNVLPSLVDTAAKPRASTSSQHQSHQRKQSSMLKAALSTVFSAIPTLRPSSAKDKDLPSASPATNGNFLQQQQEHYSLSQSQQSQDPYSQSSNYGGSPSNYDQRFGQLTSNPGSPGLPYTPLKLNTSHLQQSTGYGGGNLSPVYGSPSFGSLQLQQQSSQRPQSPYSPSSQNNSALHLGMPTHNNNMIRKNSNSSLNSEYNSLNQTTQVQSQPQVISRRPSGYLNGGGENNSSALGLESNTGGLMNRRGKDT